MESGNNLFLFEDIEQVAPEVEGYIWNGYRDIGKSRSLLKLLEENADLLKHQFKKLTAAQLAYYASSFRNNNTDLFNLLLWSSGLVEQGTMKTTAWLDSLKLLTLYRELSHTSHTLYSSITYKGENRSIHNGLLKLCKQKSLGYKWQRIQQKKSSVNLRKLIRVIPLWIRAPIHLFRYLLNHWTLSQVSIPQWYTGKNSLFFFSYFIHLDKEAGESGQFYSRQWEKLPEQLQAQGRRLNWMHLFMTSPVIPNVQVGKDWIKRFERNQEHQGHHALLDQFLDWAIVVKVVRDWLRSLFFYIRNGRQLNCHQHRDDFKWLWPSFHKDWEDSWIGPVAVQNILWIHLFDKGLGSLPRQPLGFYLQENQGWERIFLYFWRKHGHGQIIGVRHSTICYWDMRHFDTLTHQALPGLPQPDLLAVNGDHAWQMLKDSGYSMEQCVPVEALRYQYLATLNSKDLEKVSESRTKRILVLGDIQTETTHQMLLQLEDAYSQLNKKVEVWIKPHSANPVDLRGYPQLPATLKDQFLMDLFPDVGVVLASVFTSASLDAFCAGLPVINYLDPNNFNFSPLRGYPNTRFVSSAEEVLKILNDENWLSTPSGAKPSDFFWLDEELPRWTNLIQSAVAEQTALNEPL